MHFILDKLSRNSCIRTISISKSLYLDSFSESHTLRELFLSDGIATFIRVHLFSRLFLITMSGRFAGIVLSVSLTNRFHVAVRLFSNRSQMTSKCGKNKKVAHEAIAECATDVLTTF